MYDPWRIYDFCFMEDVATRNRMDMQSISVEDRISNLSECGLYSEDETVLGGRLLVVSLLSSSFFFSFCCSLSSLIRCRSLVIVSSKRCYGLK